MLRKIFILLTAFILLPVASNANISTKWDWPLKPKPKILTKFYKPEKKWLPGHRGVDLEGIQNQSVYASGEGRIIYKGTINHIQIISIEHRNNLRTTYQPIESDLQQGDFIKKGQKIGHLKGNHESCFPNTCLHWGLIKGKSKLGNYLNPLILIYGTQIILKPYY